MEYNLKEIGKRIYNRRRQLGLTLEDIGNEVGVAKSTIQRYETGKINTPKLAVLESIARSLNIDTASLVSGSAPPNLRPMREFAEKKVAVPILGRVSAGAGSFADSNIRGYIMEESSHLNSAEEYAYLRVEGDSMYPEFKDGDLVLIKCCNSVDSGSYAVVVVDDENGVIKRIEYGDGYITLHSVNPLYPPRCFKGEEMLRIRIFGTVKGLRRSF